MTRRVYRARPSIALVAMIVLSVTLGCDDTAFGPAGLAPGSAPSVGPPFIDVVSVDERPGHPDQMSVVLGPYLEYTLHLPGEALVTRRASYLAGRDSLVAWIGHEPSSLLDHLAPESGLILWDRATDQITRREVPGSIDEVVVTPAGRVRYAIDLVARVDVWELVGDTSVLVDSVAATGSLQCLSPTGDAIAVVSWNPDSERYELVVGRLGESPRVLTTVPYPTDVCFSPSGDSLAIAVTDTLRIHDVDDGGSTAIPLDLSDRLVWSADGIYVQADEEVRRVRRSPGGTWTVETVIPPVAGAIAYSRPDGEPIWRVVEWVRSSLLVELDGMHPTLIAEQHRRGNRLTDLAPYAVAWEPDGHRLGVLERAPVTGEAELRLWSVDDGTVETINLGHRFSAFTWVPEGVLGFLGGVLLIVDPASPDEPVEVIHLEESLNPSGRPTYDHEYEGFRVPTYDRLESPPHRVVIARRDGSVETIAAAWRPILDVSPPVDEGAMLLLGPEDASPSIGLHIAGTTIELGPSPLSTEIGVLTTGVHRAVVGGWGLLVVEIHPGALLDGR